jgi:predicted transcriptional regulator
MEALWASDRPVLAREVEAALDRPDLAYTTVLTVLGRLERKGFVRRQRDARAHAYSAVGTRADHVAEVMHDALDDSGDRDAALSRFVGGMSEDEAEILRRALRSHRRSGPGGS